MSSLVFFTALALLLFLNTHICLKWESKRRQNTITFFKENESEFIPSWK